MINITISKSKDLVKEVIIKGHANSAEYGKDLVCAGVSSIVIGTINALNEIVSKPKFAQEEGYVCIQFEEDNSSQIIAKTMIVQLLTVEESNKKYVKINYS